MRLKRAEIKRFRNFENIVIDFEKNGSFSDVFSIASKNGGGKSTLLQFIFIMLYCFMNEERKEYMQNLLSIFSDIAEDMELVRFIIEEENREYSLEFGLKIDGDKKFDSFLLYNSLHNKLRKEREELEKSQVENDKNRELIIKKTISDLELELYKIEQKLVISQNNLDRVNLKYITHLKESKNILLLKTEMSNELLERLTYRVFLIAPSSQVFLFLSKDIQKRIFDNSSISFNEKNYIGKLNSAKWFLDNFFTYSFVPITIILESFKQAFQEDLKTKRLTGKYGVKYDELKEELKIFLDDKEIIENENGDKIIFKLKSTGEELSPEDLSHGELRKLGIYIWLKYIVEKDSIVLMDEPDIALHPKWQYDLVEDLTRWSDNCQFLLATHSPQILSSTYYKNLIYLKRKDNQTTVIQPTDTFADNDINSIITLGMGATHIPPKLEKLHFEYRKLIESGKKDTAKAKELKEQILEWESIDSAFFKRIEMYLRFKK